MTRHIRVLVTNDSNSKATAVAYHTPHEDGATGDYFGANIVIRANAEMTGGSFGLSEYWAPEGSSAPWHIHHEADEMYYVLEGEVIGYAREDGEEKRTTLSPGSTYYIPRGTDHTYVVTSEEAKMLVMTHSLQFEDWFVELGEPMDRYELPAPASEEENQVKAAAITPELCERFNVEITGPRPV